MGITKYTVWLALDRKQGAWKHNHIERGWATKGTKPTPKHADQQVWNGMQWAQRFVYFDDQMRELP